MQLPDSLYSQDQISVALAELHTYVGQIRDSQARAKVGSGQVSIKLSPLLDALFVATDINKTSPSEVDALITKLENMRQTAPVIHLTLAISPDDATKIALTKWFRREIHPHALLAFTSQSAIGGGLILRAGSAIHDFSYRTQLLAHKNRISEILKNAQR